MYNFKFKKSINVSLIVSSIYVLILLIGIAGISVYTRQIKPNDTILNVISALENIFQGKVILSVLQRLLISGVILIYLSMNSKREYVIIVLTIILMLIGVVLLCWAREITLNFNLESLSTREYLISQITNLEATQYTVEAQEYLSNYNSLKIIGNLIILLTIIGGFINLLQGEEVTSRNRLMKNL